MLVHWSIVPALIERKIGRKIVELTGCKLKILEDSERNTPVGCRVLSLSGTYKATKEATELIYQTIRELKIHDQFFEMVQ